MIYLGSDHNGYELKQKIKKEFDNLGIEYEDLGNSELDKKDDYPKYGYPVAKKVAADKSGKSRGILICGSSFGVCIVANKVKGARAVSVHNVEEARLARNDDDANILCLSGWKISASKAKEVIGTFLVTNFSKAKRHHRRVDEIKTIERKELK